MDANDFTGIAGLTDGQVTASSFRTYYVPLNTQQDFINAYQVSLALCCVLEVHHSVLHALLNMQHDLLDCSRSIFADTYVLAMRHSIQLQDILCVAIHTTELHQHTTSVSA